MSDSSLWNEKYTSAMLAALAATSGFRIFKVMGLLFPLYVETFMLALVISLHSLWPESSFHVLITYTCWQTKSSFQCGFSHFTVRKNQSCSARILIRCLFLCGTTRRFDSLLSRPTSWLSTSQFAVCSFLQYSFYPSHATEGQAGKVTSKTKATSVTEFEWRVSIYWRNEILFQFCKGETMAWNDMCVCVLIINKRS